MSYLIPGLPTSQGRPQSQRQVEKAMDRLFGAKFHPNFVFRNPLCEFLHRIRRVNASFIASVKIDGYMKTGLSNDPEYNPPLSLARILPVMTTVLKNACPSLRSLTLHMQDNERGRGGWKNISLAWDDGFKPSDEMTDEQHIDDVVKKVVEALPTIGTLNLGGYFHNKPEHKAIINNDDGALELGFGDEWGPAARWIWIVQERAAIQAVKQAAEKAQLRELEQNISHVALENAEISSSTQGKQPDHAVESIFGANRNPASSAVAQGQLGEEASGHAERNVQSIADQRGRGAHGRARGGRRGRGSDSKGDRGNTSTPPRLRDLQREYQATETQQNASSTANSGNGHKGNVRGRYRGHARGRGRGERR